MQNRARAATDSTASHDSWCGFHARGHRFVRFSFAISGQDVMIRFLRRTKGCGCEIECKRFTHRNVYLTFARCYRTLPLFCYGVNLWLVQCQAENGKIDWNEADQNKWSPMLIIRHEINLWALFLPLPYQILCILLLFKLIRLKYIYLHNDQMFLS